MGWGCGIPEPLRMCSGLPGHILTPLLVWSHLWAMSRASRTASPQAAGYPGHHMGIKGAGPDRADARRSLKATMHRQELALHVWRLLGETPGTRMS
jgi:hypothetical protein